jgi:hypothetical protein
MAPMLKIIPGSKHSAGLFLGLKNLLNLDLNWPVKEKPRGSSLTGRKVETVALYISIDGLGGP